MLYKLQSKGFSSFHQDMFNTDDEHLKMIAQIEASIKYFEEEETLHIYGQQMWHDNAYIVGNRAALQYGEKKDVFFPNDGEGYDLYVACVDDQFNWENLEAPYHDTEIFEKRKHPIKAFNKYKIDG
ncbi:hypothetical protein [Rummeliibacillus stabekisii]|uniref:Uncharacterized protein n=1 Tax=Rummeliibacillus stabekisii TaxID=241244 RepID=A0A143HE93_9BACL|nr:hypothetical protein [Rummeliibacillus stabekisii]AMX00044.1 hypothetical protein ATY39_11785 [Rummeliibacillus stabekisii]